MPYTEFRHGALAVIEEVPDTDRVQRELRRIDDRLFLERQLTVDEQLVWCVVCTVGGDVPPITLLEWRDERGQPIHELSSGIVERVARMDRDGKRLTARVIDANARKIEMDRARARDNYEEFVKERARSASGFSSPAFHRGTGLRMARDRARNKGENV